MAKRSRTIEATLKAAGKSTKPKKARSSTISQTLASADTGFKRTTKKANKTKTMAALLKDNKTTSKKKKPIKKKPTKKATTKKTPKSKKTATKKSRKWSSKTKFMDLLTNFS